MKPLIVLEGKLDEIIVSRILDSDPELKRHYITTVAGGRSSAISLARSYLVTGDQRVVLVMDADTTDPERMADDLSLVEGLLRATATPDRFLVKMVLPEIEAVLFTKRDLATHIFGHEFSDSEWRAAQRSPKLELGRLIHGTPTRIVNLSRLEKLLDHVNLRPLGQTDVMKGIRQFILHAPMSSVQFTD